MVKAFCWNMAKLILTGCGGNVSLGGLQSRAGHELIGCDIRSDFNPATHLLEDFRLMPRSLLRLGLEEGELTCTPSIEYVEAMGALMEETGAEAILANPDPDVMALAHWKDFPTASDPPEALLTFHDKWAAFKAFKEVGVPTPETWLPKEVDEEMADSGKLMVKHRWGAGGQGNRKLRPSILEELTEREMVTTIVDGPEHAFFFTFDRGEVALEGAFQKVFYFAGEGRRNRSVQNPELRELAISAIQAVSKEPHGTYHVDIMGEFVTEVNAGRVFGGTPDPYLCWAAGISMVDTVYRVINGEKWEHQQVPADIEQTHFNNYLFSHEGKQWLYRE